METRVNGFRHIHFIDFELFQSIASDLELVKDKEDSRLAEVCSEDLSNFHRTINVGGVENMNLEIVEYSVGYFNDNPRNQEMKVKGMRYRHADLGSVSKP